MDFKIPTPVIPYIPTPTNDSDYIYADTQFAHLKKIVEDFESSLDNEHEVELWLTSFGQSVMMQVTEIDYRMPVLMVFTGYVNGKLSTLVQHVNQLNFLLTSVPKDPERPKRKIGFSCDPEE